MTHTCSHCQKTFESENSLNQHIQAKHTLQPIQEKRNLKHIFIFLAIGISVLLLAYSVYSYMQKPGNFDDFAKCLTEKGAVVYGNDACQYTNKQLNYFGNSKKYLNYIKCTDNKELCDQKGVRTTPTWEINGQTYPQVQTFETLAAATGCEIK